MNMVKLTKKSIKCREFHLCAHLRLQKESLCKIECLYLAVEEHYN